MGQKRECGNKLTRVAAAAIAVNLLLSLDANDKLALCTATTRPLGQAMDSVDTDELIGCRLPADGVQELKASGIIAFRDIVYTDAAGKITATPVNGCFMVGMAMGAAAADGDIIPVLPFAEPLLVQDLAAVTYAAAAGGSTVDAEARAAIVLLAADVAGMRAKMVSSKLFLT